MVVMSHKGRLLAAILDRILERGRLIHLDGPSGRTRHLNSEEVLPAAAERARISGIRVPEFPEPTCAASKNLNQPFEVGHELTRQGRSFLSSRIN